MILRKWYLAATLFLQFIFVFAAVFGFYGEEFKIVQ